MLLAKVAMYTDFVFWPENILFLQIFSTEVHIFLKFSIKRIQVADSFEVITHF